MAVWTPEAIHWLLGAVVGLTGLVGIAWSLFCDRSRGQRRCPQCWYDMSGSPSLQCPECGKRPKRENHLFRTRRRWRWATLGVSISIAVVAIGLWPKVERDGWLSIVPTTALILVAPPAGTEVQFDWVALKPIEHPVSAELRRRRAALRLADWQWNLAMRRTQVIKSRRRWPKDVPLAVSMKLPAWVQLVRCEVTARPLLEGGRTARAGTLRRERCGVGSDLRRKSEAYQVVGRLDASDTGVEFDCTVSHVVGMGDRVVESWSGIVRLPIESVATVDEAITPARNPALNEAVARAVMIRLSFHGGYTANVSVSVNGAVETALADVAVSPMIEFLRDGKVMETVRVPLADSAWPSPAGSRAGHAQLIRLKRDDLTSQVDRWQIRLRGDGELALRDWDRDQYWAGTLTIALRSTLDWR